MEKEIRVMIRKIYGRLWELMEALQLNENRRKAAF